MANTEEFSEYKSIKFWAEDDRPREKMMQKGRGALSNAELIAILIGTGFQKESAVDVAKKLLARANNDLNALANLSLNQLTSIKGIGKAKAVTISAALELGRRRKGLEKRADETIKSSNDAYTALFPFLTDLSHEEFYVLLLNRANRVTDTIQISSGGVSGTVADVRMIFKAAIEQLASAIIIAHNHPSGNLLPSKADLSLTQKIKEAGLLLEIQLLDHLIVTNEGYYSFADEGNL